MTQYLFLTLEYSSNWVWIHSKHYSFPIRLTLRQFWSLFSNDLDWIHSELFNFSNDGLYNCSETYTLIIQPGFTMNSSIYQTINFTYSEPYTQMIKSRFILYPTISQKIELYTISQTPYLFWTLKYWNHWVWIHSKLYNFTNDWLYSSES